MRVFALKYGMKLSKWIVLFSLLITLAACQASTGPKVSETQPVEPTQPPTAAPIATVEQPTLPPAPTATEAPQAYGVPQLLQEAGTTYPFRLIWSRDGKRLGLFEEGGFSLLDAETLETLATRTFQSPAYGLDFSPDGKTLAFTPDGQTIQLEDIDLGQTLHTLTPGVTFQRAVFSPDGRWLAVDSMEQWAYALWDVATGQPGAVLTGFETAAPIYAADFSSSGNKLIWFARGTIQVMDIASGVLGPSIGHEDFITGFSLKLDDSLLATAAGGTFNGEFTALINLWNPQDGALIAAYPQSKFASALAFSPDGNALAVAIGADILLLDPANGQILQSFAAATDAVTSLVFSPNGTRMASASSDGHIRLWSLK